MIYLATPYSSPDSDVRERRFHAACAAVAEMMKEGLHVLSPIAHCHSVAVAHELPTDFVFWRDYNEDLIRRCDRIVVLQIDGWEDSIGVTAEIAFARSTGKPVGYRRP